MLAETGAHATAETTGRGGMELPRVANEVLAARLAEMGAHDETTGSSGMEIGIAPRVAAAAPAGRA